MFDLSADPRWMRLNDPHFTARGFAGGAFYLDMDRPADWTGGDPVQGDDPFDPNNVLSDDFCIIEDKRFFIRGTTSLPILGGGGKALGFAIWVEVSRASFNDYLRAFDDPAAALPPMVGTFANRLPGFAEAYGQACTVRHRPGPNRPPVTLNDARQPLAEAQLRGVTLDRLLEIYKLAGVDLAAALAVTH
jgi:hypothetical protein